MSHITNVTFYFDDNTQVSMIGDSNKIMEVVTNWNNIKGFSIRENWGEDDKQGWDLEALKKLLEEKK